MMTHTTLLNPNQPSQCFTELPVRAREQQICATQSRKGHLRESVGISKSTAGSPTLQA